ncbi:MFS transporter [Rubrivirga sp. IMCC43871]|uniref:MFS transporter n=1 Tax=Rubrivirga sp. IMCC43871 TaxID=3391575 RepID=UPI0039900AE3
MTALTDSRRLCLSTLTAIYAAQGLQIGLVAITLPALLAARGVGAGGVGAFVGAVAFPWALKPLFAVAMDRFGYLPMGRRRPWALAGTAVAVSGYLGMVLGPDPSTSLVAFTLAAAVGNAGLGLTDVAADALAIDVVPAADVPEANAWMWAGKVVGIAATSAGGAALIAVAGLDGALLAAAAATAATGGLVVVARERPGERMLPWTAGSASTAAADLHLGAWAPLTQGLRRVLGWSASRRLVLAGACAGAAYGLFDALMPVLTVQELGWTGSGYGQVVAVGAVVGGGAGVVLGPRLIQRVGRGRAAAVVLGAMAALCAGAALARGAWAVPGVMGAFLFGAVALRSLVLTTLATAGMAVCWRPIGAAQFAVYQAAWPLGAALGGAALGPLAKAWPSPAVVGAIAMAAVAGALAIVWLRVPDAGRV